MQKLPFLDYIVFICVFCLFKLNSLYIYIIYIYMFLYRYIFIRTNWCKMFHQLLVLHNVYVFGDLVYLNV